MIGCSTAYFLTHHHLFNPEIHSVTILESSSIAGGSSGKAGGLLADWATPACLAPLSFKTHFELAQKHEGDKIWGFRNVYCADVKLQAQSRRSKAARGVRSLAVPSALDWLLPGAILSYKEAGDPSNSAQVNPYMLTTTLAKLAQVKGAKVIIGSATQLKYKEDAKGIQSLIFKYNGGNGEPAATDIVVAAGPWTPKILPELHLETPRGHSVVVRPSKNLSPYVLFPNILSPEDGDNPDILSPEIYPRPNDALHKFDTVYSCGPDDYTVRLPNDTEHVEVDPQKCEDVWTAVQSISAEIADGTVLTRQSCYKPQIRRHEENEEVSPIVGPASVQGVWIATGHDEWGIQNSAGTGLVISEMIYEGEAKSADCESLHPKHFLKHPAPVDSEKRVQEVFK